MRNFSILVLLVVSLYISGCAFHAAMRIASEAAESNAFYADLPEELPIEPTARFSIGIVSDSSGYEHWDTLDPIEAMRVALRSKLGTNSSSNEDSPRYVINIDIKQYLIYTQPFLLAFGREKMSVVATILDQEGHMRATIDSTEYGSSTDDPVFDNIASGIAEVVRNPEKRITREEYRKKMDEASYLK